MKKKKAGRKRPMQSLQKNHCSFRRKRKENPTLSKKQKSFGERLKKFFPIKPEYIPVLIKILVLLIELLEKLF